MNSCTQSPNFFDKMEEILLNQYECDTSSVLSDMKSCISDNIVSTENVTCDLIDLEFLNDIKNVMENDNISIYFGKTLRDLKLVILDDRLREHEVIVKYQDPKKLHIDTVSLPHSNLQDQDYDSLKEIISAFKKHIASLSGYFSELEEIDTHCTVMEPIKPSFKDDFRRILVDERTWLHVEISPDGLATNVYLLGQAEFWNEKLQSGLLSWNHDLNIVQNIMNIFDLVHFPTLLTKSDANQSETKEPILAEETVCSICLCFKLPDNPGVPLPLCQNSTCGVYFHRNCLFQWLVACTGGRPPAFGVSTGSCPACFLPISCNEKDN